MDPENKIDVDFGLADIIADEVHGSPSLTPEEIMMLREELDGVEERARTTLQGADDGYWEVR